MTKQTEQQRIADETGIQHNHVGTYLKDIANGNVLRKPIEKVLRAQGVKEINVKIGEVQG